MGNVFENCCGSKKKEEIKKFQKEMRTREKIDDDDDDVTATSPSTPTLKAQKSSGVISMGDDVSRLKDLYESLEEQFLYFLDKEFPFPTSKADLIESPDLPVLKFDIFFEFYKSAMTWNKILILHKKHDNASKRRKLYKGG